MQKLAPFLWFPDNAEEAANFYLSIFPNARKLGELRTPVQTTVAPGAIITISLELEGQEVTFLNGGPGHPPTDFFSFFVRCKDQAEIDRYWSALTADGGSEIQCGWCKDKFGICWQIVPENVMKLISTPAGMKAMMQMKKFDIAALEAASKS